MMNVYDPVTELKMQLNNINQELNNLREEAEKLEILQEKFVDAIRLLESKEE